MFFWVIRDKESLLKVGKVLIFKPQLNKIFFGQTTGEQSVIFPKSVT